MARFRYEFLWKVDFEKLDFTHSDRQRFKNLRSKEGLMEEMFASSHRGPNPQQLGWREPHRSEDLNRAQEDASEFPADLAWRQRCQCVKITGHMTHRGSWTKPLLMQSFTGSLKATTHGPTQMSSGAIS